MGLRSEVHLPSRYAAESRSLQRSCTHRQATVAKRRDRQGRLGKQAFTHPRAIVSKETVRKILNDWRRISCAAVSRSPNRQSSIWHTACITSRTSLISSHQRNASPRGLRRKSCRVVALPLTIQHAKRFGAFDGPRLFSSWAVSWRQFLLDTHAPLPAPAIPNSWRINRVFSPPAGVPVPRRQGLGSNRNSRGKSSALRPLWTCTSEAAIDAGLLSRQTMLSGNW